MDLREPVVRAVEAGASRRATAARFEVSPSFVIKLLQRRRQRGTVQPDRIGGSKRSTLAVHAERVHALLAAEPDLTIAELRIQPSRSAVGRFLRRGPDSKTKTRHAAEQDRPDAAAPGAPGVATVPRRSRPPQPSSLVP
ncbi:MAG: hypothetical protein ACREJ0_19590 [Geminicoccaceae bacterium]